MQRKLNVGDELWFVEKNKVEHETIFKIIEVKGNDHFGLFKLDITYYVRHKDEVLFFEDSKAFKTKEDLIKSL